MASTYTNSGIEKIGSGEQAGTWGTTTNNNLDIIDRAINGVVSISLSGASSDTTVVDGSLSDAGAKVLSLTGSPGETHTLTLKPNDADKLHLIKNGTNQTVNISQGSGGNAVLVAGEISWVFCDGAGAGATVTKQDIVTTPATFTVGTDLTINNDVKLLSDSSILSFGADGDVTITHVHDTGLLINGARELRFRDADLKILSSADGQLDIGADTELELTAPTVQMNVTTADLNGNLDVSGTSTLTGNVTLGAQLIMPDVTSAKILVADGTSYQEVAVSGDVTIANTGAVTIANDAVETAMIADSQVTTAKIADSQITSAKLASGVGGKVLQVVQGTHGTSVGLGTSFASTNLSQAITVATANNDVLIQLNVYTDTRSDSTVGKAVFKLFRGSTDLGYIGSAAGDGGRLHTMVSMTFLDANVSAGSHTYTLHAKKENGSVDLHDSDMISETSKSFITLTELAQ